MTPIDNNFYSGTGKCTIKNGIAIIQGTVNCITPNDMSHVEFLFHDSLRFITDTNVVYISYDKPNDSVISVRCGYDGILAANGTAGKRYLFACVAI